LIWLWLRQLDARLRLLVPFALAVGAALIDVLPLQGLGAWGLTPFSLLCVVYFWSLYRPDLFGPLAAFGSGIVYDALAGLPLGLSALILLLCASSSWSSTGSLSRARSSWSGAASRSWPRPWSSPAGCSPAPGGGGCFRSSRSCCRCS
jgi:hypothetical protein